MRLGGMYLSQPFVGSSQPSQSVFMVFQKRKPRLKEVRSLAQGHKDRRVEDRVCGLAAGLRALLSAPSCPP